MNVTLYSILMTSSQLNAKQSFVLKNISLYMVLSAYGSEKNSLSMQVQRHDTAVWLTGVSLKPNYQSCGVDYIYETHAHRITQWNRNLLNPNAIQGYAEVISEKGYSLDNCFGFIDGTGWPVSRPRTRQRVVYNGHKRVNAKIPITGLT